MSRQTTKDREYAIRTMTRLGIGAQDQAKLLRLGATLHRLAEAECNGDWPCDNGQRTVAVCGWDQLVGCGAGYAPHALRKTRGYLCPACCAEQDAQRIAEACGLRAVVNGDPRGMVLGLVAKDASREDVDSGRVRPEYVR